MSPGVRSQGRGKHDQVALPGVHTQSLQLRHEVAALMKRDGVLVDAVGSQVLPRDSDSIRLPFERSDPTGPTGRFDGDGPGTGADLDEVVRRAEVEFALKDSPDLRLGRARPRIVWRCYLCHRKEQTEQRPKQF